MAVLTSEEVWGLCHDIYRHHGRNLAFPVGTDRTKTYQWQYISGLAHKFQEWEFDRGMAERFLQIVVQYAHEHNLMHKGLAVHFQSNALKLCLERLNNELQSTTSDVYSLRHSQSWVASQAGQNDPVALMVRRENYGGHTNLVKWYLAGKCTELYLALSKTANKAMLRLPADELAQLPSQAGLWLTRQEFLKQTINQRRALEILQGDLKNVKHASCM